MGLTTLIACSSDRRDGKGEEQSAGTLSLALQATAPSGNVYQLRNALFQITNIRTGEVERFLSSEELPEAAELTAVIAAGSHTVTLLPGWFMVRVSGSSGGTGGTPGGFGGTFTAGTASIPVEGGTFGAPSLPPPIFGGESGEGGAFGLAGAPPVFGGEGPISTGGTSSGGSGSTGGEVILDDAQLLSDAVQFFFLSGNDHAFVNYQFKVGGDIVDFSKGTVHVGISVDDSEACQAPSDVTKPERVLLETNTNAVASVTLSSVFEALATNGGRTGNGTLLFQQIWDSYASIDQAQVLGGAHCGDETTDGLPSLNGFPIDCNRPEAKHVNDMSSFFATAFVNRMDLAPANGAHCGQQRMIFASRSINRAFMILEAQIPNPSPELGIQGCLPLAQFWMDQNLEPDAKVRGQRLAQAFLQGGVEGLAEFGFGPFYTAENLTVGSGQIRTNQFDTFPWTLREFKLALDGDSITALPFPVAESPNAALWNENVDLPQGEACRESFLTAMEGVMTDDLSIMSFVVDSACKNSESRNDFFSEDYASQLSPGFAAQIQDKLSSLGSKLSPFDVANRARFSGSCIGCHNEASGSFLGNGIFAPSSGDFPQVVESTETCGNGETGECFARSKSLKTVFLPGRLAVLSNLLGVPIVPNPCTSGGGGVGGSPSAGGSSSTGGFGTAGSFMIPTAGKSSMGGGGEIPPSLPPISNDPAPVVVIDLPSADEPVEQLQEQEQEIRDEYGDVTISGKSAKSTH